MILKHPSNGFFLFTYAEYDAYRYFYGQSAKYSERHIRKSNLDTTINYIKRK